MRRLAVRLDVSELAIEAGYPADSLTVDSLRARCGATRYDPLTLRVPDSAK